MTANTKPVFSKSRFYSMDNKGRISLQKNSANGLEISETKSISSTFTLLALNTTNSPRLIGYYTKYPPSTDRKFLQALAPFTEEVTVNITKPDNPRIHIPRELREFAELEKDKDNIMIIGRTNYFIMCSTTHYERTIKAELQKELKAALDTYDIS